MYHGYQSYLENEIMSADPLKLVELLYRGAIGAIHSARVHLVKREIRQRSKAITKAQLIVIELAQSLDPKHDPNLTAQLARLYQYIGQLLVDANVRQQDAPLAEASQLLNTLLEAWEQCAARGPAPAADPMPYAS
ncbi:MAG TPA: flagellar export chaperone FliS [Bryobacteraceae bacterium]|nr:flagellar export chaperone FliS [Bryobacteraceae bacterium]